MPPNGSKIRRGEAPQVGVACENPLLDGKQPTSLLSTQKAHHGDRQVCFAAVAQEQWELLQSGVLRVSLVMLVKSASTMVSFSFSVSCFVELLAGERRRERVVTPEEESLYLAAGSSLLASVAAVLVDTGLRPNECHRLRWGDITWANGRHGTMLVTHGKTAAARRVLPMTPRVRGILEMRWEGAGRPAEGCVWPAPTRSGHIDHSSLKKQPANAMPGR
jgi:hypothetical protein